MKRKKSVKELSDEIEEPSSADGRSTKRTRSAREEPVVVENISRRRRSSKATLVAEDLAPDPEIADSVDGSEGNALEEEEQVDSPVEESAEESGAESAEEPTVEVIERKTPVKSRNGSLLGTPTRKTNGASPGKLFGKTLFATPSKANGTSDINGTPRLERHADRSARKKSTRALIERTVMGNTSDNDEDEEDIADVIYGSDGEDGDAIQDADEEPTASAPTTPSKRGRPKGAKTRKRSPTPPQDLPPHELYFFQNRGGRSKTSNNNLSTLKLLDHEEYFKLTREFKNPHQDDLDFRQVLLAKSFNQWHFELSQDFNICLYGWGSKRSLLMKFAEHIYKTVKDHTKHKIVVVNGYVHNLTIKDVLNTVASAIAERGTKLGSQPAEMLESLIALLERDSTQHITLIIHSIDGASLRRPVTQTLLSRLASLPQIHLVASADHPSFPLMWDSSLRSTFNFLFHDCTTFQPYTSEVDVVDEVHELLGRSSRRVGGKEGVIFVLKSLPENAQKLFKVLVAEQLAAMDDSSGVGFGDGDSDDEDHERRLGQPRRTEPGVEWRVLYQKVVEEFICSNEMNFRTLLKE